MEILPNNTLAQVAKKNLTELNDLKYDADELKFAVRLQETFAEKVPLEDMAKVFDVGEVERWEHRRGRRVVGGAGDGIQYRCWVPWTPGHSWQAVAAERRSGKKGMNLAARTLAATAYDLFTDPQLLKDAKAEHANGWT